MTDGGYMTSKAIMRVEVFLKIKNRQITQDAAARALMLSLRHVQRLYKEFRKMGIKALSSKRHGKLSNHRLSDVTVKRVSELVTCEQYKGFKPLFMSEVLEKYHDIKVS